MIQGNRSVSVQPNFDPSRYQGRWYEQFRSKATKFEKYDFVQAFYNMLPDKSFSRINSQYNDDDKFVDAIRGKAWFNGAQGSVKFLWWIPAGDYRVLETDYDSYSIVYSHEKILGLFSYECAWILTRERFPPADLIDRCVNTLAQKVPAITKDTLYRTAHSTDDEKYKVSDDRIRGLKA